MAKLERYLSNQEKIKGRAIAKILNGQKVQLCEMLEGLDKKKAIKADKMPEAELAAYLESIKGEIPDYLADALPPIMDKGAADSINRYKEFLPQGYALAFDIPGTPAANYIRDLVDLYLSFRDGSILKTTRDELRRIIADGLEDGASYTEIAKEIRTTDPFVFSASRAKLIAVNEVGRAAGWANHEPGRVLQDDEGFVLNKVWDTSKDDRVRPRHTQNADDGRIPFDKPFSGTGDMYAPSTVEIRCRCTSNHFIVGIKKLGTSDIVSTIGKNSAEVKAIYLEARKKAI